MYTGVKLATTDEVPWDEDTGNIIALIDAQSNGSGPKLSDFLANPGKYMLKPGSGALLGKFRTITNTYFDAVYDDMKDEETKFTQQLESLNVQYLKINQVIKEKSLSLKIPLIVPSAVDVDATRREEITILQYDSSVEQLLGKLISVSKYVADISEKYKNYNMGSWLFSSDNAYVVLLERPTSPLMLLEDNRKTINDMLDEIADQYGTST